MRAIVALLVLATACGGDDPVFTDAAVDAAAVVDATTCAGLELGDCRRAAGCVADLCPSCGCDQQYRGCLTAGTEPAACPALGCPTAECCRVGGDCEGGATCASPGEQVCGGACNPQEGECTADRDCQTGGGPLFVCDPIPCACNAGARSCQPGCLVDEDCDEGQTCEAASGRCHASACSTADPVVPCPADFDCVAGACQRRACADDLPCDGFCVEQLCRGGLGECRPLAP